ncbi:MAG: hypothetical protein K6E19_01105 [Lachnospiraceae bacterium]|nr:hypothetical protein [Lachnospiraceae bacterium]
MDVSRLSSINIDPFMDMIPGDVAEEIKAVMGNRKKMLKSGFVIYGLYDTDLNVAEGALVAQLTGAVATIRSLYVDPFYRGFGGGAMLLDELKMDVFESGDIAEIEFMAAMNSDAEAEAAEFLFHEGYAKEDTSEAWFATTLEEIHLAGVLAKIDTSKAVSLRDADEHQLRKLSKSLVGGEDTFVELPIRKADYEQDLSMVIHNKKGEITDILLVEKEGDEIILSYAFSAGSSIGIGVTLAAAVRKSLEKYPKETKVLIPTVTDAGRKLTAKIVPNAKYTGYVRCVYSLLPMYVRVYGREKEFRL